MATREAAGSPAKPHIVLFLFDDLGFNDIGDFAAAEGGQAHCVAPVMEGLMQTGVKLKQFYAQPICSPTRAALMTGRYPVRFGGQTGTAEGVRTWIPDGEPMLPERLAAVGYSCHAVGKWCVLLCLTTPCIAVPASSADCVCSGFICACR